jgi:hypothetical protein
MSTSSSFPAKCATPRHRQGQEQEQKHATEKQTQDESSSSWSQSQLSKLVLPWASILLTAIIAAALLMLLADTYPEEPTENSDLSDYGGDYSYSRQLHTDDGYVPPTDDSIDPRSSYSTSSYSSSSGLHNPNPYAQQQQQQYYEQHYEPPSQYGQQQHSHHKPVFMEEHDPLFPLTARDYAGFVLAVMGLMVAAGGGIGGGGILVPIYILVMEFSPKHAIPLSNITVFGGAVANTLLNTRKRHPLADRPLVDWDLILVMEPLSTYGTILYGENSTCACFLTL